MKEVVLTVASKDYTVNLTDDGFAEAFGNDLKRLIGDKTQISVKDLLTAFIQKCHEYYLGQTNVNSSLDEIISNLDETLK